MRLFSRLHDPCYCAFCKSPRRVIAKKHIGTTNVLGGILLSVGISFLLWGAPEARALVVLTLFLIMSEFFVYWRWRANLVCRYCGFDPIVYKRNPAEAAQLVRTFFEERIKKPEFQLSRSPLLDVFKRMQEAEKMKAVRQIVNDRKRNRRLGRSDIEPRSSSMIDPSQL